MIVTNRIRIMRYPKHVMDKINSDSKLKKRHEKEVAKREKQTAKPSSKNGDK